jgi:methylmalonyl-CoA mutase
LGGASLDSLSSVTPERLEIDPLYPRVSADRPRALRPEPGPWDILQRADHPDPAEANRLALLDLEGGANGLTLVFEGETARGSGLPFGEHALATILEGVELDFIALRIDAGARSAEASQALAALTIQRRLTSAKLPIDLGLDPIGTFARLGHAPEGEFDLHAFIRANQAAGLRGCTFLADGRPYHDAGAGEAQELAAVLSTALNYLRRLEQAGFELTEAVGHIAALLTADADIFLTLAKFRALRRLWARLQAACGLTPAPLRLHAETSWRMMSRPSPWVNVMRTTAAIFAAATGGAGAITALPYTAALGLPEDGARRLVRNSHLILAGESHLGKVEDPAAGAGGFEALTDKLSHHAWTLFQEIEREGGIEASLAPGALQSRIATVAQARMQAIAQVDHPLTGTSAFPSLDETPPPLAKGSPRPAPTGGPLALPRRRDSEPFETLREWATALAVPPTVYLAALGPPAAYGPRVAYATNFFATGGIATMIGPIEDYAGASPLVCVCGPDRLYQTSLNPDDIARLRRAGAGRVLMAGRVAKEEYGADGMIFDGCPALDILGECLAFLSAARAD